VAAPEIVVDLQDALTGLAELWSPRIVAETNGWHVELVKVAGAFVWHAHEVDELFLVLDGEIALELADRPTVRLARGHVFVVPRTVRHRPVASGEAALLLLEPGGVANTGDADVTPAPERWL
jgi:mannose-6-phosphate isomerase-like protein (cupin superfamily)